MLSACVSCIASTMTTRRPDSQTHDQARLSRNNRLSCVMRVRVCRSLWCEFVFQPQSTDSVSIPSLSTIYEKMCAPSLLVPIIS